MKLGFKTLPPFALAFALGLGMFKLTLPLALLNIWLFRARCKDVLRHLSLGNGVLIAHLGVFLLVYRIEYIPYQPQLFSIEAYYFKILLVVCACAVVLPAFMSDKTDALKLVWYFCFGAFVFAAATVIVTVILKLPPYYGQIVDLRFLARGVIAFGNTPGIANLLTFMPIAFLASLLLPAIQNSRWFLGVSLVATVLSVACALVLQQRSFFVIGLMIEPILAGVLMLSIGRVRAGLVVFSIMLVYPLLLWIDSHLGTGFLYRRIDTGIFLDARIQMFSHWLHLILADPFTRQLVGPAPWDILPHFHNFFADIHRVSGLWALCATVTLTLYIFVRLIWLTIQDRLAGAYLLAIAIPAFLIMVSSVVPEGEKQPFIALLLVAGICERLLWKNA